jgi:hypothetical protein
MGPFFAVEAHSPSARCEGPWQSFNELVHNPDRLERRVNAMRVALTPPGLEPSRQVDVRVAASVTQLGLVARIIAEQSPRPPLPSKEFPCA